VLAAAGPDVFDHQGEPKPVCHVHRFINALGHELLAQRPGAVITRGPRGLAALAWHDPRETPPARPPARAPGSAPHPEPGAGPPPTPVPPSAAPDSAPRRLEIELVGLPPWTPLTVEALGPGHGDPATAWQRNVAGPPPGERTGPILLKERQRADGTGTFRFSRPIEPRTVVLMTQG
jgi:hypothetical protein